MRLQVFLVVVGTGATELVRLVGETAFETRSGRAGDEFIGQAGILRRHVDEFVA